MKMLIENGKKERVNSVATVIIYSGVRKIVRRFTAPGLSD
jgi:hypothetical protein